MHLCKVLRHHFLKTSLPKYVREGKKPSWTEEEEEELRKLYEEHRDSEGLLSFCLSYKLQDAVAHCALRFRFFNELLILVFSARYSGDFAAITQQRQPHSAPGGDTAGAHGSGGQC